MKFLYISLAVILLQLPDLAFSQCSSCTANFSSNYTSDISFGTGTYCFTGGSFTGNITGMSSETIICIGPDASFKPLNINGNLKGIINVYGTLELPNVTTDDYFTINNYKVSLFKSNIGINSHFTLNNYGDAIFNGNLHFNGSNSRFNNISSKSYLFFNYAFQLSNYGKITNYGLIKTSQDFNSTKGTTIDNSGTIRLNGSFNPSGYVMNNGLVVAQQNININPNANVTNHCKFVSVWAFKNNSYFKNDGLVWVTGTNGGERRIQNNSGATYESGPNSITQGVDFTNSGTVKGSGEYYFTGNTRQQGSFTGTSSSSGIRFYDIDPKGEIFDFPETPSTQHYTNTYRTLFMPSDTIFFNCSKTILPVTITSFDAKAVNKKEVLVSWQTATEANTKAFVIERIDKPAGGTWQAVNTVNAAGFSNTARTYQFTDKAPLSGISHYRLRAVDVDGKITISTMKQVNLKEAATLQIYPNLVPKGGVVKVISSESLRYQLLDMSGKVLLSGTFSQGATVLPMNLNAGTYMVRTTGANQVSQHAKIIVQ